VLFVYWHATPRYDHSMRAFAVAVVLGASACGRVDFEARSVDALAGSFCSNVEPEPRLCDDFDELPFAARWAGANIEPNGHLSLDASTFVSSPDALFLKSPISGTNGAQVALFQTFTDPFVTGRIELDIHVDTVGDAGTRIVPARVVFGTSSIGFGTHANSSEIVQLTSTGTTMTSTSTGLVLGRWTHVRLDVDLSSSAGVATLAFDGTQVATVALDSSFVPAAPRFEAGLAWIETTSTLWSIDLDNVELAY